MIEYTLSTLQELAKKTVCKAGLTIIDQQKLARQIHQSHSRNIKIEGDSLSESIIFNSLQQHSSFSILSEEAGIIGEIDREQYLQIVDPLDGSLNYYPINACKEAKSMGIRTLAITGFDGCKMRKIADDGIHVQTGLNEYGPAEDIRMILDHLVSAYLMSYVKNEALSE